MNLGEQRQSAPTMSVQPNRKVAEPSSVLQSLPRKDDVSCPVVPQISETEHKRRRVSNIPLSRCHPEKCHPRVLAHEARDLVLVEILRHIEESVSWTGTKMLTRDVVNRHSTK